MLGRSSAARLCCGALLAGLASPASGHEFWLDPLDFHPAPEDRLIAHGMVGETLEGETLGYYPEATVAFDLTLGEDTVPVSGETGQIPAVDMPLLGDGLHVLRFQSANYQVSYPTMEKFTEFLEEWDQTWVLPVHAEQGFPVENIRETYFRYAKALVDAGGGAGRDRAYGMPLELIALDNPYAETDDETVEIELRFLGAPFVDGRVKVFRRAPDGAVEVTRARTDGAGRLRVPRAPGFHLVNAVHLDLASPRMQRYLGASWQSLWASLTYDLP